MGYKYNGKKVLKNGPLKGFEKFFEQLQKQKFPFSWFLQGKLTEGKGSVQCTSSLSQLVL
jgi:hypothetical protein